ncbi:MAG: hypothetical protein KH828_12480 [Clostridiales bacterium]|nr:hypothetical protein [Clostridiales bacterium]
MRRKRYFIRILACILIMCQLLETETVYAMFSFSNRWSDTTKDVRDKEKEKIHQALNQAWLKKVEESNEPPKTVLEQANREFMEYEVTNPDSALNQWIDNTVDNTFDIIDKMGYGLLNPAPPGVGTAAYYWNNREEIKKKVDEAIERAKRKTEENMNSENPVTDVLRQSADLFTYATEIADLAPGEPGIDVIGFFTDFLTFTISAGRDYMSTESYLEWADERYKIRQGDGINVYKPNIYLYGEAGMKLEIIFEQPHLLTETIPSYGDCWKVELAEDGTLTADGEKGYPFLFYESKTIQAMFQREEGFLIAKEERAETFQKILEEYGFNEQEIQDFVEFWDEKLENEDYYMYPQLTETVDRAMPVRIEGAAFDNYQRIWFGFKKAGPDRTETPNEPEIVKISHEGRAMVEWGGMIFK